MLAYPIEMTPDDNGTFLVTCPDLPEVTTYGNDEADCMFRAVGAIEEALGGRISDREEIPRPSEANGRPVVAVPLLTEMKVGLYLAMKESGMRKADLAKLLNANAPTIDRLLDLRHSSRVDKLEAAFSALHKRVELRVI
jgi:antitoxin HicB